MHNGHKGVVNHSNDLSLLLCAASLAVSLGGCELFVSPESREANPEPEAQGVTLNREVDVLFVIDNSGSMTEEQTTVVDELEGFVMSLRALPGGSPDLHVGVVTTDMGASTGICESDQGILQNVPQDQGCESLTGRFLSESYNDVGELAQNFTGTLNESLSCIAPVGVSGCGFESPLEAAKRALDGSNQENAGFLRDDALLLLVIVSDEDDCSTPDQALFGDPNADLDSQLGPFSSFRCFEFGVECDSDVRGLGTKTNCTVREDSLVSGVDPYVEFLSSLKGPGDLVVASIHGRPQVDDDGSFAVEVVPNQSTGQLSGTPTLAPACSSSRGLATPAIRLESFASRFANSHAGSICDESFGLDAIAASVARSLATTCLVGPSKGLRCTATVAPGVEPAPLPECAGGTESGCFELVASDAVCGAAIHVRGQGMTPGHTVSARCDLL